MFFFDFFFFVSFFVGLMSFLFFRFHYLLLLLSVEIMMLSLFFGLSSFSLLGLGGVELVILYLVLMVCGAGFGICLMIYFARMGGNEMFSFSL
uniref:NADH dehydrogenase subunit 4L n=1 Tax=Arrenurus rostratus TaxID=3136836 RepID=A0AAU6QEE7_9ACAR